MQRDPARAAYRVGIVFVAVFAGPAPWLVGTPIGSDLAACCSLQMP